MASKKKNKSNNKNASNQNTNLKKNNVQPKNDETKASSTKEENKSLKKDRLNKEINNNKKIENNDSKKENKNETQEEKVVFKNKEKKSEDKSSIKKDIAQKNNSENAKKKILEEKENKKRKLIIVLTIVIVILVIGLVFSTIFAMMHSTSSKIAKGITIKGIDVSDLTYSEAKEKLDKTFKTILDTSIDLNYKDEYSYNITSQDIEFSYDFNDELEEAYALGRKGNIIECNYSLIFTALMKKDINFEYKFNEDTINSIVDEVATSIPGLVTQYSHYIENDNLIISSGKDGIQVEKDELKKLIINNLKNRNPLNIKNEKIEIPYKEVKAEEIDIDKIYSEVHTEPKDAYFEPATENRES